MKPWTLAAGLLFAGVAGAAGTQHAEADIVDSSGKDIGTLMLTQTPNGVLVKAEIEGLPEGEHGFHFHEKADCDTGSAFKSAGSHYAPRDHQHGMRVSGGPHAGDMPNQFVQADGKLRVNLFKPDLSLEGGDAPLLDSDGSALVIHAEADDYESQPSGDAGDRIACAEITKTS